ncbi:unnamed protein product [Closterium sp. NIES-54]
MHSFVLLFVVLPSPPLSSLPVSPTPISKYYRAVRPVVSHVLATVVTNPRFSPSSVSALTAAVADFATASPLDYSTRVVPTPPTHPLSVGGHLFCHGGSRLFRSLLRFSHPFQARSFPAAHTITLTQSHMVQQVLQRFGFQVSATQPTPLAVDHRLTGPFPDEPFEPSAPYPELVGCLMYLMTFTCPDLAYPLSVLSCFVGPGRHRLVHWTAVVRVATYLVTTSGMGLLLGGNRPVELTGLCDSSYADDVETQRSTQGYCFSLRAGAVSWRSTRSSSVASSSAKAEIYAGAMASQELR